MRWFFVLIKIIFFIPLRIIFPCSVVGKSRIPKKKTYITVTNHLSTKDVIMLGLYLPGFRYFLAKKELAKNKSARFWLKMFGAVYIDRQGLDLKAIKTCISCLKNAPLAIFPEGTRNQTDENLQAVKGGASMIAVKAGVDIYPVMLHHRVRAFRRNYVLIGENVALPYTKEDRFNAEAMGICTGMLVESMNQNKELLNNLVTEKRFRAYNSEIRKNKSKKPEKQAV